MITYCDSEGDTSRISTTSLLQSGDVVCRKEKESTGTSLNGGCCHWMT